MVWQVTLKAMLRVTLEATTIDSAVAVNVACADCRCLLSIVICRPDFQCPPRLWFRLGICTLPWQKCWNKKHRNQHQHLRIHNE